MEMPLRCDGAPPLPHLELFLFPVLGPGGGAGLGVGANRGLTLAWISPSNWILRFLVQWLPERQLVCYPVMATLPLSSMKRTAAKR